MEMIMIYEIVTHPSVFALAAMGLIGLVLKLTAWYGYVNSDRTTFKRFMEEMRTTVVRIEARIEKIEARIDERFEKIQDKIEKIFERLPPSGTSDKEE